MIHQSLDRRMDYSLRRQCLDIELEHIQEHMHGQVLEIGAGRQRRRGRFVPPLDRVEHWWFMDRDATLQPDVQSNMEHLPFRQASINTVVCLEVLEYVTCPEAALREVRRVLTDCGVLVLSVPFFHRADTPHDYWRFTAHGLRHILAETGFRVASFRAQGAAFGSVINIVKHVLNGYPLGRKRRFLGAMARPFLAWLWRRDEASAEQSPTLASFSTGFLVVAHPQQ